MTLAFLILGQKCVYMYIYPADVLDKNTPLTCAQQSKNHLTIKLTKAAQNAAFT